MIQDEYFKKWLDDKFAHLESKIDNHMSGAEGINVRLGKIEERVDKLEDHNAKDEGMWKAYGRLSTIAGGVIGGIVAWLTNKFF